MWVVDLASHFESATFLISVSRAILEADESKDPSCVSVRQCYDVGAYSCDDCLPAERRRKEARISSNSSCSAPYYCKCGQVGNCDYDVVFCLPFLDKDQRHSLKIPDWNVLIARDHRRCNGDSN